MFQRRARTASRPKSLERRLFTRLLTVLLAPALIILIAALVVGSLAWRLVGPRGPWKEVAASGRALLKAAAPAARSDTSLARALDFPQRNLSASLTQARRW